MLYPLSYGRDGVRKALVYQRSWRILMSVSSTGCMRIIALRAVGADTVGCAPRLSADRRYGCHLSSKQNLPVITIVSALSPFVSPRSSVVPAVR